MCYSEDHAASQDLRKNLAPALKQSYQQVSSTRSSSSLVLWSSVEFLAGILIALGTIVFSLWFPFFLTPKAAEQTYHLAFWNYNDASKSHFDNTVWTYGTDYGLAVVMSFAAMACLRASHSPQTRALRIRSAGLLLNYALSVTAGGWAHHMFTTRESRNTLEFRTLWTICVGTVTMAGAFMGSCASQVGYTLTGRKVSDAVWVGFGVGTTLTCVLGGMSFHRPACDIFVAGVTQVPPTILVVLFMLYSLIGKQGPIGLVSKLTFIVAFVLNAPLLPCYACFVQYTHWTLAQVNTLCHANLLVAWSMQACCLAHFIKAMDKNASTSMKPKMR